MMLRFRVEIEERGGATYLESAFADRQKALARAARLARPTRSVRVMDSAENRLVESFNAAWDRRLAPTAPRSEGAGDVRPPAPQGPRPTARDTAMNAKRRTNTPARAQGATANVAGRKGPFGNILRDDPYTAEIQGLLRRAKSSDEAEARAALVELFYRFRLRLPLEEERLGRPLPWNREPSRN